MIAYFLNNNGLGDNLYSIGAVRFLSQFYDKVYFLCKDKYYENVKLFFLDNDSIDFVPFHSSDMEDEKKICSNIIKPKYEDDNVDIFICGYHVNYLTSKKTNQKLIQYTVPENTKYSIEYDTITIANYYGFIECMYKDIQLNLSIMFEYFYLPPTNESLALYEMVNSYNIVFIHMSSSNNVSLNISNLLSKYLYDEKTILICSDANIYSNAILDNKEIIKKKYLCDLFVNAKLLHYLDTILNSQEIYIIDSCFTGIVLPLLKTNKLKACNVRIIMREFVNAIPL